MKSRNYNVIVCDGDLPVDAQFPNGMAAVDTETMGLNVHRDKLCLVQVANGEGDVWLIKVYGTDYSAPNLRKVMEDSRILKLFHYARFDVAVMKHYMDMNVAPVYCTKIASKLVRTNTERHGLKMIVAELLGANLDKEQQSSYWATPELTESQKHYAASDVIYLHQLKEVLDERLKEFGRMSLANECFKFIPTRCDLDLAGWDEQDIFSHM